MKYSYELAYMIISIFTVVLIVHCEDEKYFEDEINTETLVDPHSFYYDKQSKQMIQETNTEIVASSVEEYNEIEKEYKYTKQVDSCKDHEAIYYKRLINLLLSNINIMVQDDISVVGILEIKVSRSQMEMLKNFHDQKISLRKIDEVISNGIRKPLYNYTSGVMHDFFDALLKKFEMVLQMIQKHPDGAIIVFIMLMVCLMFRMIKRGRGFPMFIIIQVIFVMSFFMTWWQLIQDAEIKAVAEQMKFGDIPVSCQPHKMNLWDKFVSFVTSSADCEKYYKITMSNPKLKITPAYALSHFITTVVLYPITYMGTVVSDFINNATDDLPWTYAWIIKCILFICVGIVIIIMPFCLSGASMNLGLGPLLKFEIDYHKKDRKGNSLQNVDKRDPVQVILQVPHTTQVPAIEGASKIEKSKPVQISKTDDEAENSDVDSDLQKLHEDLSYGDIITNIKFSKSDSRKLNKHKRDNEDETKKNNGSGDC